MHENQSDKKDHNFLSDNRITLLAHFKKAFKLGIENAVLFKFFLLFNLEYSFLFYLLFRDSNFLSKE
jgi:hypothetical protein